MRKRFLTMLLALIMVVSVVPMVAMAEGTGEEHDCWDYASQFTYVNNGNGTHTVKCPEGHEVQTADCVWDSSSCICGSTKPVATHDCWDGPFTYEYNGNGTHTVKCPEGHTVQTTTCVWESGKCACGSEKPACDHTANNWKYTNNNDGTHTVTCKDCGEVVTANAACVWESGKCACGSEKPACDHMGNHWEYTDNKDGTHKVTCKDCGKVVTANAACVWESGKCACGSVKPVETCDHVGVQTVVDNKDGKTHKTICPKCGEVVIEKSAHVYDTKTGKCACGAEKPTVNPTEPTTTPSKPSNNQNDQLDNVPKTGDNGTIILMSGLLITGLFGTAAYIVCTKKKVF